MKPFDELTYLAKVRRFRRLARVALDAYGLAGARLKLVRVAGNAVFRVFASKPPRARLANNPYVEGQYLLRIHHPGEQATAAIELEMEWLVAMRRDAELPVPEPVPTLKGNLLTRLSIPGIPGKRDCSLLRWLQGRLITKNIRPHHFRAQGRLMAQMHNHAAHWQPPKHLTKRRFDRDGLFNDDAGAGLPNSEAWSLLPSHYLKPFGIVSRKVKQVMDQWGEGPEVYGLIHADCGVDANVLFWKGEARVIDFDGSGFGYYAYDLSLALEHCWDDAAYPQYRDALLEGYAEFRSLTDEQLRHMDLFLAASYVYMSLWTAAMDQTHPNSPNGAYRRRRWQERGMMYIKHHMAGF